MKGIGAMQKDDVPDGVGRMMKSHDKYGIGKMHSGDSQQQKMKANESLEKLMKSKK